MTTMFGDVTDLQQHPHPQNILHLVEKNKGFPLKAKSFRNIATDQKLSRRSINPPLCHGRSMTLLVRPGGLRSVCYFTVSYSFIVNFLTAFN